MNKELTSLKAFRLLIETLENYNSQFLRTKQKMDTIDGFRISTIEKELISYADIKNILNNGYLDNNAKIREIRKVINNE